MWPQLMSLCSSSHVALVRATGSASFHVKSQPKLGNNHDHKNGSIVRGDISLALVHSMKARPDPPPLPVGCVAARI